MELAHLKAGDDVNVEVHEGGTLTVTPIRPRPSREEVSKVVKDDDEGLCADDEATGMSATPNNCFHLTVEIVRGNSRAAIAKFGGSDGVREMALLESAWRPQATFGGQSPYKDLTKWRRRICSNLCRTIRSLTATNGGAGRVHRFLRLNGIEPKADGPEWEESPWRSRPA